MDRDAERLVVALLTAGFALVRLYKRRNRSKAPIPRPEPQHPAMRLLEPSRANPGKPESLRKQGGGVTRP